jgi:uncharacterized membrane protein
MVYIVTFYVCAQVFVKKQHFMWHAQKRQKKILYVVMLKHEN